MTQEGVLHAFRKGGEGGETTAGTNVPVYGFLEIVGIGKGGKFPAMVAKHGNNTIVYEQKVLVVLGMQGNY